MIDIDDLDDTLHRWRNHLTFIDELKKNNVNKDLITKFMDLINKVFSGKVLSKL